MTMYIKNFIGWTWGTSHSIKTHKWITIRFIISDYLCDWQRIGIDLKLYGATWFLIRFTIFALTLSTHNDSGFQSNEAFALELYQNKCQNHVFDEHFATQIAFIANWFRLSSGNNHLEYRGIAYIILCVLNSLFELLRQLNERIAKCVVGVVVSFCAENLFLFIIQ